MGVGLYTFRCHFQIGLCDNDKIRLCWSRLRVQVLQTTTIIQCGEASFQQARSLHPTLGVESCSLQLVAKPNSGSDAGNEIKKKKKRKKEKKNK